MRSKVVQFSLFGTFLAGLAGLGLGLALDNFNRDRPRRVLGWALLSLCAPASAACFAFRQRKGRTLPFVTLAEGEGVALAQDNVSRLATIHADEASHWDTLHAGWTVHRINHSEAYSMGSAGCTNQVESYFSRLRRMITGQHHGVSPRYLSQYAHEAAWKEDHRRESNGLLADRLLGQAMAHPVSRKWAGYWQRAA